MSGCNLLVKISQTCCFHCFGILRKDLGIVWPKRSFFIDGVLGRGSKGEIKVGRVEMKTTGHLFDYPLGSCQCSLFQLYFAAFERGKICGHHCLGDICHDVASHPSTLCRVICVHVLFDSWLPVGGVK